MAGRYPKQFWQSGTILAPYGPLSGSRLQHIEDWLAIIIDDFDGFTAGQQFIPIPSNPPINGVVYKTSTGWGSALVKDVQVAADAAISKSKLNLTGQITEADLSPTLIRTPTGGIIDFGGDVAPTGWVLCDGTLYDGNNPTYTALWNVIGNRFGGSGKGSFAVPDYRGRMPVMKGTHGDVDQIGDSDGQALGTRRPAHSHAHTLSLPNHAHSISDPGHSHAVLGGVLNSGAPFANTNQAVNNQNTSTSVSGTGITVGGITSAPGIPGGIGQAGMPESSAYLTANRIIKL